MGMNQFIIITVNAPLRVEQSLKYIQIKFKNLYIYLKKASFLTCLGTLLSLTIKLDLSDVPKKIQ